MRNIYELFESKIEEELDEEYFRIQESLDEFLIIEKIIDDCNLLKNNPTLTVMHSNQESPLQ